MSQPEVRRHGRRLRALGDAFHRSVKYSLRPLDWQQFAEQFAALPEPVVRDLYVGLYKEVRSSGRRVEFAAAAARVAAAARLACASLPTLPAPPPPSRPPRACTACA